MEADTQNIRKFIVVTFQSNSQPKHLIYMHQYQPDMIELKLTPDQLVQATRAKQIQGYQYKCYNVQIAKNNNFQNAHISLDNQQKLKSVETLIESLSKVGFYLTMSITVSNLPSLSQMTKKHLEQKNKENADIDIKIAKIDQKILLIKASIEKIKEIRQSQDQQVKKFNQEYEALRQKFNKEHGVQMDNEEINEDSEAQQSVQDLTEKQKFQLQRKTKLKEIKKKFNLDKKAIKADIKSLQIDIDDIINKEFYDRVTDSFKILTKVQTNISKHSQASQVFQVFEQFFSFLQKRETDPFSVKNVIQFYWNFENFKKVAEKFQALQKELQSFEGQQAALEKAFQGLVNFIQQKYNSLTLLLGADRRYEYCQQSPINYVIDPVFQRAKMLLKSTKRYFYSKNSSIQQYVDADAWKAFQQKYKILTQNLPDRKYKNFTRNSNKVAILGDYGTPLIDAYMLLQNAVTVQKSDTVINLGDVYYVGNPEIYKTIYKWLQGLGVMPKQAEDNQKMGKYFHVPGNHDYYDADASFLDFIKQTKQQYPFFKLEIQGKNLCFIASDTSYADHDSIKTPLPLNGQKIQEIQLEALYECINQALMKRQTICYITHHQPFSQHDPICGKIGLSDKIKQFTIRRLRKIQQYKYPKYLFANPQLYSQLFKYIPFFSLWIFGHQHASMLYQDFTMGVPKSALVGNSSTHKLFQKGKSPYSLHKELEKDQIKQKVTNGKKFSQIFYDRALNSSQINKKKQITFFDHCYAVLQCSKKDHFQIQYFRAPSFYQQFDEKQQIKQQAKRINQKRNYSTQSLFTDEIDSLNTIIENYLKNDKLIRFNVSFKIRSQVGMELQVGQNQFSFIYNRKGQYSFKIVPHQGQQVNQQSSIVQKKKVAILIEKNQKQFGYLSVGQNSQVTIKKWEKKIPEGCYWKINHNRFKKLNLFDANLKNSQNSKHALQCDTITVEYKGDNQGRYLALPKKHNESLKVAKPNPDRDTTDVKQDEFFCWRFERI